MKDLVLAIDNGTQSVRALVFDLRGNLLAKSQVVIEPYFSRQPGWAEQHPDTWWQNLLEPGGIVLQWGDTGISGQKDLHVPAMCISKNCQGGGRKKFYTHPGRSKEKILN